MTKFIKLTEAFKHRNETSPVLINVDNILSVKNSDNGKDTHIQCSLELNKYFFVKETVDEVWSMINERP